MGVWAMGAMRMKTTVEISDDTLEAARQMARKEGTSLRALIEQGLRQVLASKRSKSASFKLKKASYRGKGLSQEFSASEWSEIREAAYKGHGA